MSPYDEGMPELPEVEITARLLDRALCGARDRVGAGAGHQRAEDVRPAAERARGRAHRRRAPPRQAADRRRRRGGAGAADPPDVGRAPAAVSTSAPGRATAPRALLVRTRGDGRELRLREFGSKQAAWVKLLRADELEQDDALATLGPEAWPRPAAAAGAARRAAPAAHAAARPARDRRASAARGSTRSCGRPSCRRSSAAPTSTTDERERAARGDRRRRSARALEHYEQVVALPIPDKLPMPLRVHRHEGEPCPRCGDDAAGGALRGLRDRLLPDLPDRGARAQGSPALAAAALSPLANVPSLRRPKGHAWLCAVERRELVALARKSTAIRPCARVGTPPKPPCSTGRPRHALVFEALANTEYSAQHAR